MSGLFEALLCVPGSGLHDKDRPSCGQRCSYPASTIRSFFPQTGRSTVEALERLGHEVEFPLAQTCCGQMHFNTGYQREAVSLVRRFVEVFLPYEAVVAPSDSCVGMVRELYPMAAELARDRELARRIEALAPKVFELSEFLVRKLEVTDVGASYPQRVT